MEIISEQLIEQDHSQPTIVVIKVHFEYNGNDIIIELVRLLESLHKFFTSDDNVLVNLQIISTEFFHSWAWEKALYVARQITRFPVFVFLTQTTAVSENYLNSNKSLKKFRSAMDNALLRSDSDVEDYDDIDDGNYEIALKLTLLNFAQLNGADDDESVLERMLQRYHCLEEILTITKK